VSEDRWIEQAEVRSFDVIAPFSPYVETYWLPTIGPSATWLYRRLVQWLAAEPDGLTIDLEETGRMIGLYGGVGKNASVVKTGNRLVQFHIVEEEGRKLRVRMMLPCLTDRQVEHLPERLRRAHTTPTPAVS
jgi:hypothetical protein